MATLSEVLGTFDACGLEYKRMQIGDGWEIVITRHGGHVFGPFHPDHPEGLFWTPESVKDPDAYRYLIENRIWNTGGDRVWIAPEIQFNIRDRSHFRETLDTPKTIDPGNFSMKCEGDAVYLAQEIDLTSYNTVTGTIHLDFSRAILKAEDPLRKLADHADYRKDVTYCGFEQILDLSCSGEGDIYAETWDLLQIRPKGTLFIPMYQPLRGTDHYEPAGDHEALTDRGVTLRITGDSRYKIAYKAAHLTGRFGYLADSDTEDSCLIIINYPNNPSAMYSEEPPLIEGDTGYSIHIYNDDGNAGGFAEMECNLQTIGNPTGIRRSIDRLTKWIYAGKKESLRKMAKALLGYDFPE
mgnify:CR=1 FL=1